MKLLFSLTTLMVRPSLRDHISEFRFIDAIKIRFPETMEAFPLFHWKTGLVFPDSEHFQCYTKSRQSTYNRLSY